MNGFFGANTVSSKLENNVFDDTGLWLAESLFTEIALQQPIKYKKEFIRNTDGHLFQAVADILIEDVFNGVYFK